MTETWDKLKTDLETSLGEPLLLSGLSGSLNVLQRKLGHRHSIDDAMTAWFALRYGSQAHSYLDLGTGIGTVGLGVLSGLPASATMTCVEAQEVSFRLLDANIKGNGLSHRCTALHGDLRELDLPDRFDLVTGSPPYFPPHAGTLPKDSQKAFARFELRGNLGDYAAAARRHVKNDGIFVYCFPFQQHDRGLALVQQHGFRIIAQRNIQPTKRTAPLFSVFAATLSSEESVKVWPPLIVEGDDGLYSDDMLEVQRERGFGPQGTNSRGLPSR